MSDDQVGRFIKKTLKIYKALRVLERNKAQDSPHFSKSIEKLIRYFAKKFPENCGVEGSLSDLSESSAPKTIFGANSLISYNQQSR